jgi:hypothetical protein
LKSLTPKRMTEKNKEPDDENNGENIDEWL